MKLELVKKHFDPNAILDIGAHFGEFNLLCRKFFPEASILSIEGNKDCEVFLKEKNVNYLMYLLGDSNRKVTFYKNNNPTSTGHSIYKELTNYYNESVLKTEDCELKTLDWVLQTHNIVTQFDLLKIDTQGSEVDILKGATTTLKTVKGIILEVSYKPYNENAPLENDVVQYMLEQGFVVAEEIDINHIAHQRDLLFIKK